MYRKQLHLHFIGIGGIGMSGIATILRHQGYVISGCDADLEQPSITQLQQLGCVVHQGNNSAGCADDSIDIVVYSSAIKPDNPELLAAQAKGIPTIGRALMLAELMRTKYSIAISGAHGKTTTTSLISHILIEAECDPTVIIGGVLKSISTNARFGKGNFLVAEADESDRSLLHLQATLAVITNIDYEHVDTYKDLDDIKQTFIQFLNNLPFYGKAIVCVDDANIRSILPIPHIKTITYGIDHPADLQAAEIELQDSYSQFVLRQKGTTDQHVIINMPGRHNTLNALAAIAICQELGVPLTVITKALASFKGVERRFSFKGSYKGADFFDDYGHHPEEIRNTLLVARKRARGKLIVVFQPHRYTRTEKLWDQFITELSTGSIDHLIITDIYPASEAPIAHITSQALVAAIKQAHPACLITYAPYEPSFSAIKTSLEPLISENDLILLLGAGKMNYLAEELPLTKPT